jgi:hypothetical protein
MAMSAAEDSSWLLDERFGGLLDTAEERAIADQARALYRALNATKSDALQPLLDRLVQLGVDSGASH